MQKFKRQIHTVESSLGKQTYCGWKKYRFHAVKKKKKKEEEEKKAIYRIEVAQIQQENVLDSPPPIMCVRLI